MSYHQVQGVLSLADSIGLPALQTVLRNLAETYGEGRYRASHLIEDKVTARESFYA